MKEKQSCLNFSTQKRQNRRAEGIFKNLKSVTSRQFKISKFAISYLKKLNAQNKLKTKLLWKLIDKFFSKQLNKGNFQNVHC